MNKIELAWYKIQFSRQIRLKLYETIAAFVSQGVPVHDCLTLLAEKYANLNKSDVRAIAIKHWADGMGAGSSFAEMLAEWAPENEVIIIRAGEKRGNLGEAMLNAIVVTEAASKMTSTITSQLAYPAFLTLALVGLIVGVSMEMMPSMEKLLPLEQWPSGALLLKNISYWVQTNLLLIGVGVLCLSALISALLPRYNGVARPYLDKMPPFSFYRILQSSSFLVSLGSLLKAGEDIESAVTEIKNHGNPYVSANLSGMLDKLAAGDSLGSAMKSDLLSKETGVALEVYGDLNVLQDKVSTIGERDLLDGVESIGKICSMLRNVVLIGVVVVFGWVMQSFFEIKNAAASAASSGVGM
ncbi:type II secretion system F family protein [Ferrimonas marina]|uniref:Type II secretory pathway, component PulF n=1 Tax=Ferrimonas marina TaxID=299255 RepID=A0A1M5TJF6_9GAMM|nr:type II secretion system F family protein [Ferrimonas marina]SHH50829.1 Type II secretory pathway, component PulF [Ferrimonas marina]